MDKKVIYVECPRCGASGAIATNCENGLMNIYCNTCHEESSVPIWIGISLKCRNAKSPKKKNMNKTSAPEDFVDAFERTVPILQKGERVELIPVKGGVKVVRVRREEVKK